MSRSALVRVAGPPILAGTDDGDGRTIRFDTELARRIADFPRRASQIRDNRHHGGTRVKRLITTWVLIALMLTSVTSFVMTAQAVDTSSDGAQTGEPSGDGTQVLRMATVENVAILESGDAQIGLLINIAPGQLADMYRSVLAAPADAGVGEEMPIPENKTVIGGVIPVRDEFVYSIKKEQKQTFGFELSSFDTTMVPNTEKNGIIVRVSASASTQVAGFTDVGSDVRWEILVGPKDDNATAEAAGSFFTKFAFARMMLESLEGVQVYEASRSTRIRLPVGATLLNGGDLDGRSWVVNFGGGTSATVSVFLDGPSTVLIDEKTVVAEQSITAAPTEVFEAFRGYGVFRIQYQLPGSSFVGGAGDSTSYSRNWRWDDSIYWRDRRALTLTFGGVTATLTVTPSFSFSWFIGWSFWDDNWPDLDWFKAWVGASASLDIELDITASAALDKTWEQNLFPPLTLATFPFTIGFVPVWVDLDLNVVASLHVNVDAGLRFYAKASIGASLKGGAQWVDGDGWSLIKESDAHATLTGPDVDIWTNGRVELGVGLRLELLFFSLAGPYIELQPYGAAALTYYAGDDILVWDLKTGLRLNAGLTMAGWIKDLLDIHDHWWNLYDWTIKEWSGHLGDAPSSISISLAPGAVYIGALTLVTGTITSPYPGSKGGTVDIEYSADGANWIQAGKTSSKDTGEYSFRWIVWDAGTFYVHARWAGNSGYRGATSASAVLPVSAVVTGLQWLAIDDGSWNIVTFPSWPDPHEGIANRFATPVPLWRVETISLFGTWYGLDGEMTVEVWDSNLNQLIQSKHRYSDVFPQGPNWCLCTDGTGPEWHDVDIPDVTVAGDFYVAVAGDPRTDLSYPSSDDNYLMLYWDTSPPPGPGYTVDIESDEIIGWDGRKALIQAGGRSVVEDHGMYWLEYPEYPDTPVSLVRTNIFHIDNDYAVSSVKFRSFYSANWIQWRWHEPDGTTYRVHSRVIFGADWDGSTFDEVPIEGNREFYEQHLDRPFQVEVYFSPAVPRVPIGGGEIIWSPVLVRLALTETFIVTKYDSYVTIAMSAASTSYGESVRLSSRASPSFSSGTTAIQFSTDGESWTDIASGVPSNGDFSTEWTAPSVGVYYIRAVWSGYGNYAGNTSAMETLTVARAPASLETHLSSDTVTNGSTVVITATMAPALVGRSVALQYTTDLRSVPDSNKTHISLGTTNSAGQYTDPEPWRPPAAGVYGIRSIWFGDENYSASESPSVQLTVEPAHATRVEIVSGADAVVDRAPNAIVEFGVQVKDLVSGQYLSNTGGVDFYVSDGSNFNILHAGFDADSDGDGIYRVLWDTGNWPQDTGLGNWSVLGPQYWSAEFTGTLYMPSSNSTNLTIYYYGVALWLDPTFEEVSVSESNHHTIYLQWNREEQDTFTLSLNGLDPSWYTLSQTTFTLTHMGQREQVGLTVHVPHAATILADYKFTVTATSQADPGFSVAAGATQRVDFTPTPPPSPAGNVALAVQPDNVYLRPGSRVTVDVLVTNDQNFDDTITVELRNSTIPDPYRALIVGWFSWNRIKVFVPAGASISVPLVIEVFPSTSAGTYIFRAVASSTTDYTVTAEDSGMIAVDNTAPTTSVVKSGTPGLGDWYVSDIVLSFVVTDDLSGVALTEYNFDGASWISYTGPVTISNEGPTTVYFRSADRAGNVELARSETVRIDKTPPVLSSSRSPEPNALGWNNVEVTVTFVCTDAVSGPAVLPLSPQFVYAEGPGQSVAATCMDAAGNIAYLTVSGINIDKTPPETSIESVIDGTGTALADGSSTLFEPVTFTFAGTDATSGLMRFECSLDGAAFATCSSPFSGGISVGTRTFRVRAVDAAGNVDASPAIFTWVVVTPAAAVHSLQDLIESMGLPTGVESSLEAPLKEAVHILNDDNPSNDVAVCGKLGAFLHQVDAKEKSGKLGASEAEELRLVATRIQVKLGC